MQGYQQKNTIFHQVTADAPQSANDLWVTNYNTTRSSLQNTLTTILGAPTPAATQAALTTYLSSLTPTQADDTRFILQSYIGHYVNETSTVNLVTDLTNARNAIGQELSKLNLNYADVWAKEQYLSKDKQARTLETQLAGKQNQIATNNLQIETINTDISTLNQLKFDATAAGLTTEATAIQNEIDVKNALKVTLQAANTQLTTDSTGLRTQIDPLRAYASELTNRS